jgi:hypothetical protein
MRPRASHCSGGNLRAAWRPLITATRSWLLVCRAPARPRPQRLAPARLCPIRYPPRFGERTGMGRARSGHPIRTAILSYAKHGRRRANAQERTFLRLFAAAERPGRRIKAYGFGLCGSVFRNVLQGQVDHGLCASARSRVFRRASVARIERSKIREQRGEPLVRSWVSLRSTQATCCR